MNCMLYHRKKTAINCPKCGEEISLDDCFKDKAAENELKSATLECTNQDCPWEGFGKYYMVRSLQALLPGIMACGYHNIKSCSCSNILQDYNQTP